MTCTGPGGTVSAIDTITVTPAVAISISPTSAVVASGGIVQFAASVSNAQNIDVFWSTTGGTISTSGLFTAPNVSAQTALTVTVTSVQDQTKSASAKVTVTASPIIVTGITPQEISLDSGAIVCGMQIDGTGFAAGDQITISDFPVFTNQLNNPTSINFCLSFVGNWIPGSFTAQVCSADGKAQCSAVSPASTFVFNGNFNNLAVSSSYAFIPDESGTAPVVRKFSLANGSEQTPLSILDGPTITADNSLGYLVGTYYYDETFWWDETSGIPIGSVDDNSDGLGTFDPAANNGVGCITRSIYGRIVSCFALSSGNPTVASLPAGTDPWPIAMSSECGGNTAFSYDRATGVLYRFNISEDVNGNAYMAPAGTTPPLVGFTVPTTLRDVDVVTGNWYIAMFGGGCTGAVYDTALANGTTVVERVTFFDGNAMAWTSSPVVLPARAFRMASDSTHGTMIVAYDDPVAGLTRFASVNSTAGNVVELLGNTSTIRGGGLAVSPDGEWLYYGVRDQFTSTIPNQ